MLQNLKVILICFMILFCQQLFADKGKDKENDVSNYLFTHNNLQFIFLYPVIEEKVKLKITIPKNFKALEGDPNSELLEFIPKTDKDPYKWSEIITLTKILGSGITASDYITKMNEIITKNTPNAKVIETEKHTFGDYQDASSIVQYQSNGREEVVIFYSMSGPLDIANVQYALPLSSPDQLKDSVQKLKDFIKQQVEVVKQENVKNDKESGSAPR